ncbi:TrkA-N domain-containing protein [Lentzea waywayandensis]|uniref:TrkA-N domain-containing protein n=1 Tax=Lentzea waywayandensis TaxID=84724 RepID=A0A1I6DFR4_9PSEU|nr:NAD-binding protein [Lentzea waywayandensis]SFR04218.1 TrkA-N domain-containing protein [Lentzea waywayandensis]
MTDHILVIGYGDTGRCAVNAVLAAQPDARLTVLDIDLFAVVEAMANGASAILGDGRDRCALDEAAIDAADRVIVAVPDDLAAFLITRAVRPYNPDAVIVVVIREAENHALFLSSDATSVHIRHPDELT